jgi:competence protein ComEC
MTLFVLGAAWLAGIAVSDSLLLIAWQWTALAALAAAAAVLHRASRPLVLLFACIAVLCAGAARLQAARASLASSPVSRFHTSDRPVELIGVVDEPPEIRDRSAALRLRVQTISLDGEEPEGIRGHVVILASPAETWRYGDLVRAYGYLTAASGTGKLSPESLAREGVTSWMPYPGQVTRLGIGRGHPLLQLLFGLRSRAEAAIRGLYPDPEASLLEGILLGEEARIPIGMRREFATTGTSHIVAISGFNLTVLTGALLAVTGRWLGARRGALVSAAAICAYTIFVGAAPPVSRAAVTAVLALAAKHLGRTTDGLASLAGSAGFLTLGNPLLLGDLGFQLSFAATLGLVIYSGKWSQGFGAIVQRLAPNLAVGVITEWSAELVWSGLAAQLTTLPVIIAAFHRFSWVSLLANPIVLPVQPAVMGLGGISAILGSVWQPLGQPIAWLAWVPLAFTHHAVRFFASIPSAALPVLGLPPAWGVAYGALLVSLSDVPQFVKDRTKLPSLPRLPVAMGWMAMVLAAGLMWQEIRQQPDHQLHVRLLDTGGESLLIESPAGRFVLIGGGPSPVALSDELGARLPVFHPRLDWVVLRSPDSRDTDGLLGLNQDVHVGGVLLAGPSGGSGYRAFVRDITQAGRPVVRAIPGQAIDLGGGARLQVLDVQEGGGALLVSMGRFRMAIIPAGTDMNSAGPPAYRATAALLPSGGDLAHNSRERLQQLDPLLTLLAVEAGNRDGSPPSETMAWLAGHNVLRTDLHGWVELETDGVSLSVRVERP